MKPQAVSKGQPVSMASSQIIKQKRMVYYEGRNITMENEKKLNEIPDDALEAAAGGYLQVSKWVQYVSGSIFPHLYNLASMANENDKSIIDHIVYTLRRTTIPGAAVAQPVKNLWLSFDPSAFRDSRICNEVANLLQSAYQYIVSNS